MSAPSQKSAAAPKARAALLEAQAIVSRVRSDAEWWKGFAVKITKALIWVGVSLLVSLVLNVILWTTRPHPRYFVQTRSGHLYAVTALNQPNWDVPHLRNWAAKVISRTLSISYTQWRRNLSDVRKYYSPTAFVAIYKQLTSDGGLLSIALSKHLELNCVVNRPPVVPADGVVAGHFTWIVDVPITLSFEPGQQRVTKRIAVLRIQRVDTNVNPLGIEIVQLDLKPDDSGQS